MTAAPAHRIFLSYRRDDCAAHAGWLADSLRRQSGAEVFLDVDTIGLGENFVLRIEREIERCDVVLVLIGREWLTLVDADGQPRLFDELDWVHLEIKAALERDIPVVPVLVEGARMPRPQHLPEPVRPLAFRNGFELSPARWEADVGRLLSLLPPLRNQPSDSPDEPAPRRPTSSVAESPQDGLGRAPREAGRLYQEDVVVVAARVAYPEYLNLGAYICGDDRFFRRGISRMGFYSDREIHPEFPLILERRDHVLFSLKTAALLRSRDHAYDVEIATLIEQSLDPNTAFRWRRNEGQHYQVFCLTDRMDERTLRLKKPVHHSGAGAWTQNQRYLSAGQLEAGPTGTHQL